jgi:phytoene dehydrogenase-like protein
MEYEVIVVGGGVGGLTTAALLAARGVNVCLFERQSQVGGCVADFEHLGFKFEPTYGLYSGWEVGGTWERIWSKLSGAPPAVKKLSPGYVVRLPVGRDIAVSDERDRFESELERAFPDFRKPAIEFFRALDYVAEAESDHSVEKLLAQAPADFRLFLNVQLQTFGQCTSAQCSAARVAELLVATRKPVWSIDGGGQELANRLAQSLKASGGTVRLNAPVLRLAYASDGVPVGIDLLSGERILVKRAIISNLTVWDTYGKLVGPGRTPKAIAAELRNLHAWGAYLLFLSMDEGAQNRLAAGCVLVAPSGDGEYNAEEQFGLRVSDASPARAPDGKRAVTVTTFTEASDWFSFHEDETSLEVQDQAALETCWARLHQAVPELGDSVEVIETATPRTFYETTRRKFGMIGAPFNSAGAPASVDSLVASHFPNLFLIGDTVSSGFGVEAIARKSSLLADLLTAS